MIVEGASPISFGGLGGPVPHTVPTRREGSNTAVNEAVKGNLAPVGANTTKNCDNASDYSEEERDVMSDSKLLQLKKAKTGTFPAA